MAVRVKWFVPGGEQAFHPFGIDCEGAATRYAGRGGSTFGSQGGDDSASPAEAARRNRAFWAGLGPPAPADRRRRWWELRGRGRV